MNMTITGRIAVLVGPSKEVSQEVLIDGIRRGRGALMAEFLKGGLGQGAENPMEMGEFQIIRPAMSGEIDPVKGFSLEEKEAVQALWESVKRQVEEGKCTYLILDGIGEAITSGLIPLSSVLAMLSEKPERVDVILTGQTIPKKLQALAREIRKLGEDT